MAGTELASLALVLNLAFGSVPAPSPQDPMAETLAYGILEDGICQFHGVSFSVQPPPMYAARVTLKILDDCRLVVDSSQVLPSSSCPDLVCKTLAVLHDPPSINDVAPVIVSTVGYGQSLVTRTITYAVNHAEAQADELSSDCMALDCGPSVGEKRKPKPDPTPPTDKCNKTAHYLSMYETKKTELRQVTNFEYQCTSGTPHLITHTDDDYLPGCFVPNLGTWHVDYCEHTVLWKPPASASSAMDGTEGQFHKRDNEFKHTLKMVIEVNNAGTPICHYLATGDTPGSAFASHCEATSRW